MVPDVPAELEELPAPASDVASGAGAAGATGPEPIEDVAVGVGDVGILKPELDVDDVVVTIVVGVVGVVTVPTPPEPSMVTLAVPDTLAASTETTPQTSAMPPTELAAIRLTIWCRDRTT